jgi:hypothetical protein
VINYLWLLFFLYPVYVACAAARQQMRENDRFMRELEKSKRRVARGLEP